MQLNFKKGHPVSDLSLAFSSLAEWELELEQHGERHRRRAEFMQAFATLAPEDSWKGHCTLCDKDTDFSTASLSRGAEPNFREELVCRHCNLNARMRAGFQLLGQALGPSPDAAVYATEQASNGFVWLQRRYRKAIGSEYGLEGAAMKRMQQYLIDLGGKGSIRLEDVTRLNMPDGSLDAITTFDVLEHVPDYRRALGEFARTLRPGGYLVLTAPFLSRTHDTLTRARIGDDGEVEHILPAEYHGDPMEKNGILCYYHFGWDLLDKLREAGFASAQMVLTWAPGYGLADNLWTLLAKR